MTNVKKNNFQILNFSLISSQYQLFHLANRSLTAMNFFKLSNSQFNILWKYAWTSATIVHYSLIIRQN